MKFQIRDIELLRIIAACKDIPCILPYDDEAFSEDYLASLPYVRHSKCGDTFRLTDEGYAFLDSLGFGTEPDQHPVGKGITMERRILCAHTVILMYRAGVDVFGRRVPFFLPAFLCRRERGKGSVLGNSTLLGLLVCETKAYAVIYDRPEPLTLEHELDAARRFALSNGVLHRVEPIILSNGTAITHWKHEESLYLVSLNDTGAMQIRTLVTPNYHAVLTASLYQNESLTRTDDRLLFDGFNEKGVPDLYCPECNVTKIHRYLEANSSDYPTINIITFRGIAPILKLLGFLDQWQNVGLMSYDDPMAFLEPLRWSEPFYTPEVGIFHA